MTIRILASPIFETFLAYWRPTVSSCFKHKCFPKRSIILNQYTIRMNLLHVCFTGLFLLKFRTHLNSHLRTCNQLSFAWILWAVFNWQFSVWICCVAWLEIRNRWSHCHGHIFSYVYTNRYCLIFTLYIFVCISPFLFHPKSPKISAFFFLHAVASCVWWDDGSWWVDDRFRCQVIHPFKKKTQYPKDPWDERYLKTCIWTIEIYTTKCFVHIPIPWILWDMVLFQLFFDIDRKIFWDEDLVDL